MDSPTIDNTHTRAICDEIGERLRMIMKISPLEEMAPEQAADLRDKLDWFSGVDERPEAGR